MKTSPLPPLSPELIAELKHIERPGKFPRGYFDPLVPQVGELLKKTFRLHEIADMFIAKNVLPLGSRTRFMDAMKSRRSRLQQLKAKKGEQFTWKSSPYYESVHAVANSLKALCGAHTGCWVEASLTANKCARCKGVAARQEITVADKG